MKPLILAACTAGILLATVVTVVADELSPDDVRNVMDKGIRFLKDSEDNHGRSGKWPEYAGQEGGICCLCTLALLNAGVSETDPCLERALKHVRSLRPQTTYVVGLQTMVLCRTKRPEEYQDTIAYNVRWLEDTQIKAGAADRKGGWSYGANALGQQAATSQGDGSNSQFALLALYEAARAAETHKLQFSIRRETWELARNYWINNHREDDGGWGYYRPMQATGSMTCAGISSMVIVDDVLHEPDAKVNGDRIDGCYRAPSEDRELIDKGIEWLRRNFTVHANPPSASSTVRLWHYYFLYGLERAGRLSARRKIGEHDWYREGANYLVHEMGTEGLRSSWRGSGHAEDDEDIATSLALLFLSKGRWPALLAKAQYGNGAHALRFQDADKHWNWHRNDVSNLTIHTGARWDMELTWQVIDINRASVDDLLQVPVLFFSGNGNPLPEKDADRQALVQNLRDYIDRGGFIFADGETCSGEFDKGFRQLMDLVFESKPEYHFKKLDASHPIWTADENIPPDQARLLLGIDYGCRTSVVYAPADPPDQPRPSLACLWELSRGGLRENYSPAVKEQIAGGLAIGVNVLAYATNRDLKPRDMIPEHVVVKAPNDPFPRGKFAIAKLKHLGGCDAAPRALANLMEQAAHDLNTRVEAHPKLIDITDPALFDYPVVFMHGRNVFRLTDGERKALHEYVERGGLLFADAICGNEAFAESFRREMAIIFPKNALVAIPGNDPIWTKKYGGADLSKVKRRDPQPGKPGEPPRSALREVPPELKGVRIGDRYGVIFSEFDLSCALEKHDSSECRGYTREDAARIGLNVIRYGMQQ